MSTQCRTNASADALEVPRAAAGIDGATRSEGVGDVVTVAVGVDDDVAEASGLGEPTWPEQATRAAHSGRATTGRRRRLWSIDAACMTIVSTT
jgi:hypothetical protein